MANINYYLEFFLTRYCNQDCYYCSIFKTGKETECDIDKIKHVLDLCPDNTIITMSGGEIGLIKNVDDVYKIIRDHKNVKGIIALSNGLLRKRGVDWLGDVEYVEHPIKDIIGTDVIKFYDMPYLFNDNLNIIVGTEMTVKSVLFNWDYFKNTDFVTDKFYIKIMANKTHSILKYAAQCEELFTLLNSTQLRMVDAAKHPEKYNAHQKLCMYNPPYPYIDFDENLIGHCASSHGRCNKVEFTDENFRLLLKGMLFNNCDYCLNCYTFDHSERVSKAKMLLSCKKGIFQNRTYR